MRDTAIEVRKLEGWDKMKQPTVMFVRLSIIYTMCLVLANIIAVKIISIEGFIILPAAVIIFPIVYIIDDIMTEVYGMKLSMVTIKMSIIANILMVLITYIAMKLPFPAFWQGQKAFEGVFKWTWRIVLASIIGCYFGEWSNSVVISRMKVLQNGRNFPLRAWISTVVGEGVDTLLFITIAFISTMPNKQLVTLIVCQYLFKVGYEGICLPITTRVTKWWKIREGLEVYDYTDNLVKTYRPL
jgi:hypothetical protein